MTTWHKSKAKALGDGFDSPHLVTGLDTAFGGRMAELLPEWDAIPENFRHHRGDAQSKPWIDFQGDWFFKGDALRHLGAIQASWEPKHEHKQAAVAWLAWRWFAAVSS